MPRYDRRTRAQQRLASEPNTMRLTGHVATQQKRPKSN